MTTSENLANILTELASKVEDGFIVELGSYHGKGTIALAKKAKVPVCSIDDWQAKHGWIGERYGPEDEEVFWNNVESAELKAKVSQIQLSFMDAAENWEWDIGLLYWDPGVPGRFEQDFKDWSYFVIPNGLFIAKDTAQGHLGTFPVIEEVLLKGDWERFDYWNGVSFLRRLR